MSVATVGNEAVLVIAQGDSLPRKGTRLFRIAKAIQKGSAKDVLTIPVIQAVANLLGSEDTEHADCHIHIGSLTVSATDHRMSRDLPVGSAVDVTIEMTDCQGLKVYADVELLDERFEATVRTEPYGVTIEDIKSRFAVETQRLTQIQELQKSHPIPEVATVLELIDRLQHIQQIETQLARAAEGEKAAQTVALKAVLELAATLNVVWEQQTYQRTRDRLSKMRKAATGDDLIAIDELDKAVRTLPADADPKDLKTLEAEVDELDRRLRQQPYHFLLLCILALGGLRVTSHQHQVHEDASALGNRLIERSAPNTLTSADLQEIETMNRKVRDAYPDLQKHIDTWIIDHPGQQAGETYGTTVGKG